MSTSQFEEYKKRAERVKRLEELYQAAREFFLLVKLNQPYTLALAKLKDATERIEHGPKPPMGAA